MAKKTTSRTASKQAKVAAQLPVDTDDVAASTIRSPQLGSQSEPAPQVMAEPDSSTHPAMAGDTDDVETATEPTTDSETALAEPQPSKETPTDTGQAEIARSPRQQVADPTTDGATLQAIAASHPELWAAIAMHPRAYPGLLDWLNTFGGADVKAAVATRRSDDAPDTPADDEVIRHYPATQLRPAAQPSADQWNQTAGEAGLETGVAPTAATMLRPWPQPAFVEDDTPAEWSDSSQRGQAMIDLLQSGEWPDQPWAEAANTDSAPLVPRDGALGHRPTMIAAIALGVIGVVVAAWLIMLLLTPIGGSLGR